MVVEWLTYFLSASGRELVFLYPVDPFISVSRKGRTSNDNYCEPGR